MKTLWPQSLAGRLIIWLMLVLTLALVLATTSQRINNERLLAEAAQKNAVNRVTMVSRILEEQHKGAEWQQTLHAATSDDLQFSFGFQGNDVVTRSGPNTFTRDNRTKTRTLFPTRKKPKDGSSAGEFTMLVPHLNVPDKEMVKEKIWIIERSFGQKTNHNLTSVSRMEFITNQLEKQKEDRQIIPFNRQGHQGIAVLNVETIKKLTGEANEAELEKVRPRVSPQPRTIKFRTKLDDGRWLDAAFKPEVQPLWTWNGALFLGVLALAIGGVIVLVVRSETKPMQRLAIAAEALGRGESQQPLDENGPQEVRAAVKAFNLMGARLGRFVQDRTRMLAAMSHDLRTPLTTLRLRAEMIDEPETRKKLIETIEEMHRITEASLSFAREEDSSEATQDTDLTALVADLCAEAREIGKDAKLDTDTPPLMARVRPAAMRRAVRNLIDNAVRYGTCARVCVEADKNETRIIIDDDGPGIDETQLEEVFTPFVRLESSRNAETGGAGLGLSIARTIARSHGGDVVLRNRDGGGLRAVLSVPCGKN